jgi:hypothetical protein
MTTNPTTESPAFTGWFRLRGARAWSKRSEGDDYDAAMGRLLNALQESGDLIVLRAGDHPARQQAKAVAGQLRFPPPAVST